MYKLFSQKYYPPITNDLSLEQTIEKLKACPKVIALALFGSTARKQEMAESSDFDIFVIVDDDTIEIDWLLTYIDNRISDILILRKNHLLSFINDTEKLPIAIYSSLGTSILMLRDASVIYDPGQFLEKMIEYLKKAHFESITWNDQSLYERYFYANASIKHRLRTIGRTDKQYRIHNQMLLNHTINELCFLYFVFRNIDLFSQKEKLVYLKEHDLQAYQYIKKSVNAWRLKSKLKYCIKFAQIALEPVGGLWPERMTAAKKDTFDVNDQEKIELGVKFWNSLFN